MGEVEAAEFETDVLTGFVLARAAAGLTDSTIRNDTNHLGLIRDCSGTQRPTPSQRAGDAQCVPGLQAETGRPGQGLVEGSAVFRQPGRGQGWRHLFSV
jgi:integrase/recombinase XerD